ncbi:MAG: ComEC/Rec2 family competence protein [Bryobacteraceae bacterium]
MRLRPCLVLLLALWFPAAAQQAGGVLPRWSPGELDIHHINTGKGDAIYFIFPDGTTLLADAGATARQDRVTPPRPDGSRRPGEWIARYIRRVAPDGAAPQLDYLLITHFHDDHLGGLADVAAAIPIGKVLDRGWPDYNWPSPLSGRMMESYRAILKSKQVERFQPGRKDQIVPLKAPRNDFEIRNLVANGEIWTGEGVRTRQLFPPLDRIPRRDWPDENMLSAGFVLRYGKFDYFRAGDIPGVPAAGAPAWHDVETPVAKVAGPVDVNVCNHHAYQDTQNAALVAALRPRVHIIPVWAPSHPGALVLARLLSTRLYPGPRDIFATNLMPATREVIGASLDSLKANHGHIVVRVAPGGAVYRVMVLDDAAETWRVLAVHGPYESR